MTKWCIYVVWDTEKDNGYLLYKKILFHIGIKITYLLSKSTLTQAKLPAKLVYK